MKTEDILKIVTEKVANMISTKTVIGESIMIEGKTIIPVTRVSFGFGSGGGEGKAKSGDEGIGSGGGAGAVVQPIGFIVVTKDDVKLFAIQGKDIISQLGEVIPQILEKFKSSEDNGQKEEDQ